MKDIILRTIVRMFLPFIIVYGFHVIIYGHLGPGGGFSGGVIIGSSMVLYGLPFGIEEGRNVLPSEITSIFESLGGLWYITVGLIGFFSVGYFLANSAAGVYLGTPGRLLSSGLILWINIAIGIKVAATVVSLYYAFWEGYENGNK